MADKLKKIMQKRMDDLEAASDGGVTVRPNSPAPTAPVAPPVPAVPRPPVKLRTPSAMEEELQRETEERRRKSAEEKAAALLKRKFPPTPEATLKNKAEKRKVTSFSDQE